jgi:ATP-binding cassette subfamily F protein 3
LDLAGSLLFSGDDINKKVRVLSGGEKSRVALGQVLLKRASVLLLDEPTNHLDFDTVEALTQALANYEGSVVIVSHDRGFVRRTASKILELRAGRADFYPGTYDEYVWSVQKGALSNRDAISNVEKKPVAVKQAERLDTPPPKFNFKERKKNLEREVRAAEKEMGQIDAALERLKAQILDRNHELLSVSGPDAAVIAKTIAVLQAEADSHEARYLVLLEQHEAASRELEAM